MPISVKPAAYSSELAALSAESPREQQKRGYADTLREILQQPATWRDTSALLADARVAEEWRGRLATRPAHIVFTGSGSSAYAGECLAPALQASLGTPCLAVPAGSLLTTQRGLLPSGAGLLVSIARSGDSPESTGAVDQILASEAGYAHLAITCNAAGRLATHYRDEPRMSVLCLAERTNDRSLVMTSSFSNMLLAGSVLQYVGSAAATIPARLADGAAEIVERLFERYGDALAAVARRSLPAAVYLGSGAALGVARESALKMLEMSGGAVRVLAESYLGLRHGPMSWLDDECAVVAYLSGEPRVRRYEHDLLLELNRKRLGGPRVVVGESVPEELVGGDGLAVELPGLDRLDEVQQQMVHVVVGQLLAFFRCLALGQRPDEPSQGVLTRVVETFALHATERNG